MLDSGLGHGGTFAFYGFFALCGFAFIAIYVPETKGLSEKEKKELFLPGGKYGPKLHPEETKEVTKLSSDDSNSGLLDSD